MRTLLLLVSLLSVGTALARPPVRNISDLYGGQNGLALLRDYDSVRACLLEPVSGDWNNPPASYEGYRIRGTAILQGAEAKLVLALLQDTDTYLWPDQTQADGTVASQDPGCQPFYHARLELSRGDEVVAVNFCFFCPGILVARNGKVVASALLGPRSPEMLRFFAKRFPRDKLLKMALSRPAAPGK